MNSAWGSWTVVASGCYSSPSPAGVVQLVTGTTVLKVATLNAYGQHQVITGSGTFGRGGAFSWGSWVQLSSAALSAPSLQRLSLYNYRIFGKGADGNVYYADF